MKQFVARAFQRLYPEQPKISLNREGDWLRRTFGAAVFFHIIFFVVSIVYIGFESMISEIFFGCFAYSCYLTLKQPYIFAYLFAMSIAFLHKIYELLFSLKINVNNMFFFITSIVQYGLIIYFVALSLWKFRKAGGIKGTTGTNVKTEKELDLERNKISGSPTKKEQVKEKLIDQESNVLSSPTPTPGETQK